MRMRGLASACVVAALVASGAARADGEPGAPVTAGCVFGAQVDSAAVGARLDEEARRLGVGPVAAWDLSLDRARATLKLRLAAGEVTVGWELDEECGARPEVAVRAPPGVSVPA